MMMMMMALSSFVFVSILDIGSFCTMSTQKYQWIRWIELSALQQLKLQLPYVQPCSQSFFQLKKKKIKIIMFFALDTAVRTIVHLYCKVFTVRYESNSIRKRMTCSEQKKKNSMSNLKRHNSYFTSNVHTRTYVMNYFFFFKFSFIWNNFFSTAM